MAIQNALLTMARWLLPGRESQATPGTGLPCEPHSQPREESVFFVIDGSASMGIPDYLPNRFIAAIEAIAEYIGVRATLATADVASLIVFNSNARVVCVECPLSEAKEHVIDPLRRMAPTNGTNIAAGLTEARRLLKSRSRTRRVILLTDGHGGQPEPVAAELKAARVIIDVIGVGGSPACVNETSLRQVASTINGQCRYRFIGDRGELMHHFRTIATDLVYIRK